MTKSTSEEQVGLVDAITTAIKEITKILGTGK